MNLINEMSLSFPSKSSNEAFARSAVSAFVIGLDPTVAELSDIKTAVSEAGGLFLFCDGVCNKYEIDNKSRKGYDFSRCHTHHPLSRGLTA